MFTINTLKLFFILRSQWSRAKLEFDFNKLLNVHNSSQLYQDEFFSCLRVNHRPFGGC